MDDQQLIRNNFSDVSLAEDAGAKSQFCSLWPTVRTGLEMMRNLLKNPIVKVSITGIITAGDMLHRQICG